MKKEEALYRIKYLKNNRWYFFNTIEYDERKLKITIEYYRNIHDFLFTEVKVKNGKKIK